MKKASSELSLLSEVYEEPEQSVPLLETPPRLRSLDPRTAIAPAPYATVVARSPLSSLPVPIATHVLTIMTPTKTMTPPNYYISKPTKDVPLLCLSQGLSKKAALSLQSLCQLVTTLDGRDKITKILQYLSRFFAWYLSSPRMAALKTALTSSRKAFRLGRSLLEVQKLRQCGLLEQLERYLENHKDHNALSRASLLLYRPVRQAVSDCAPQCPNAATPPLWQVLGKAIKMIGLFGFWGFDNYNFVLQSGALDDYRDDNENRVRNRQRSMQRAAQLANKSYFAGAVAGLITNWYCFWDYRAKLRQQDEEWDEATRQKHYEKHFSLFVALLKSVCDVLVFSNNPGIDLWKKYRGRKMHEGFHCLCGLTSASTVIYNSWPNKKK